MNLENLYILMVRAAVESSGASSRMLRISSDMGCLLKKLEATGVQCLAACGAHSAEGSGLAQGDAAGGDRSGSRIMLG